MTKKIEVIIRADSGPYIKLENAPEDYKILAYQASFYADGAGAKKAIHHGPTFIIEVDAKRAAEYEIIIGDDGIPKFVTAEADPVDPSFVK